MTTEKTAVALRVLAAYNRRQHPEERDVLLLRAFCPEYPDMSPDEMACIVIEEMIENQRRKQTARVNGQTQPEIGPVIA